MAFIPSLSFQWGTIVPQYAEDDLWFDCY